MIDSAAAAMRSSSRRIDNAAINIANVSTPGFKRQLRSSDYVQTSFEAALAKLRVDLHAGKLNQTGRPLDLAIEGDGFFQLRAGNRLVYSRQGAFALDANGQVVTPQGYVLQQAGGGDLVLEDASPTISADGTITSGDRLLGRVAVLRPREGAELLPIDGSIFSIGDEAVESIDVPTLRQGMLEASNVSLGDEMIGMMSALRGAETGARLVQVYDELMGKAISTFGQTSR